MSLFVAAEPAPPAPRAEFEYSADFALFAPEPPAPLPLYELPGRSPAELAERARGLSSQAIAWNLCWEEWKPGPGSPWRQALLTEHLRRFTLEEVA
jgi:hypothetical protein